MRDMANNAIIDRGDNVAVVMYTGKVWYGTSHPSVMSAPQKQNQMSIDKCFNCEDPRHMLNDCPLPLNTAKVAARKLETFNNKKASKGLHMVLEEVFHQIDCGPGDVNQADKDTEILYELLADVTCEAGPTG